MRRTSPLPRSATLFAGLFLAAIFSLWFLSKASAGNWADWRGPEHNGVSRDLGLPDKFSLNASDQNSNLLWKAPFGGRSTPIVMNGRVYLIGNVGEGSTDQERVVCFNADTGERIWEHRFNVFFTDIVAVRVGWTNLVGDPETDCIYAHGVQGLLFCFNGKDGKILWSRSLTEEYGRISGYGGRVCSPIIDGDLVIVGMLNASWGQYARGGNRFVAFNKQTGEVVWWSETGFPPKDTYYSVPVVATINGERVMITGGGDGGVHAFQVRTGKKLWSYMFGTGAVNCSPVVQGTKIYIGHGEENLDNNIQGRTFCLDGADVKDGKPKVLWNRDGIKPKYCSPLLHEGRLYICDETARMYCLDADTGKTHWSKTYGRNAKGSPVWADGKIYVAAVNSQFVILKPKAKACDILHKQTFQSETGSDVEINGSPAVANNRVYLMTSEALYCIGLKDGPKGSSALPPQPKEEAPSPGAKGSFIQVLPADAVLEPGESATFRARVFDAKGHLIREERAVKWSLAPMIPPPPLPNAPVPKTPPPPPPDLKGAISSEGKLTVDKAPNGQFGTVVAELDGVKGMARVRVAPTLPYKQDFEKVPLDRTPAGWVNTQGKFVVRKVGDSNVLVKTATNPSPLVARANAFIAKPNCTNYTVESDVMGARVRDDLPDMGVVACRYTFFLDGNKQQLRLVSWDALPRIDKSIDFPWKAGEWYRMKITAEVHDGKAQVKGKIWSRGAKEPEKWTLELEDDLPNPEGSPALYANATGFVGNNPGTEIFFDNVSVGPNKK